MSQPRQVELILYIGQTPLRAGRVALAFILWRSDFDAYASLGESITGARYVKAARPGDAYARGGILRALLDGLRWGNIEYRLITGTLWRSDAEWIADRWADGVPV